MFRLFRDCLGCCLTWLLFLLVVFALAFIVGLPPLLDAVDRLARTG